MRTRSLLLVLGCLGLLSLAAGCAHPGLSAAREGDLEALKAWILTKPAFDEKVAEHGGTVLHAAARAGQAEAAALLAAAGADPDAVDERGDTALCVVARQKEPRNGGAVAAALLSNRADPNRACGGEVPLHYAAVHYSWDVAREVLQRGGKTVRAYAKADEPLSRAALSARADVVALLLKAGADPNLHETAAMFDALNTPQQDSTQVVSLLVQAGADLSVRQRGDGTGDTALHRLVTLRTYGAEALVDLMVQHGANTYAVNDQGLLPVDTALEKSEAIAARMIRHMAEQLPDKGPLKAAYAKVSAAGAPVAVMATVERLMGLAGYIHAQARLVRERSSSGAAASADAEEAGAYDGVVAFASALVGALGNAAMADELDLARAQDALDSLVDTTRQEMGNLAEARRRQKLPESASAQRILQVMQFVRKLQKS
jgi:ankyrin repeat protein